MPSTKQHTESKNWSFLFHILGWLTYALFHFTPILMFMQQEPQWHHHKHRGVRHLWEISPALHIAQFVWYFVLIMVVFYVNYSLLLPRFLKSKNNLNYTLGLIALIATAIFIDFLTLHLIRNSVPVEVRSLRSFISFGFLFSVFLSVAISISAKVLQAWYENEKQKTLMRNQQLLTELSLLKSQVNPHFLFNSLNNIRMLVRKKSDRSEEAILKLSDMMRYMLHESVKDKVLIDKELSYVKDFVELQKLRIAEGILIEFEVNADDEKDEIAPMLLLPLIENAFKHGISYRKPSFVKVSIDVKNKVLTLHVTNTIHTSHDLENEESGLGLSNLKRRLDILYPEKHVLDAYSSGNIFISSLTIHLSHVDLPFN